MAVARKRVRRSKGVHHVGSGRAIASRWTACPRRLNDVIDKFLHACLVEQGTDSRNFNSMDGGWSTFLGQCASSAHCQCPGRGTLVKLPQLRDAERFGTRGCGHCCSLWQLGRTGRSNVGQSLARRPHEWSVHVDVSSYQRGRFEEEVRRRRFARWPVTRESRYGMRGFRVGEASNPGPPAHRVRRVADSPRVEDDEVLTGTRRRRRRLRPLPWSWDDTDSDEPEQTHPTHRGRHVVPRRDRELPATVPTSQTPEEVPLHVVDALQEDLDPRHAPRFPRSSEFELSDQNRFAALDSTVRDSNGLRPTSVDGSGVDTFPMTENAAMQVSVAEMGDLTRVDTDEESLPRNGTAGQGRLGSP